MKMAMRETFVSHNLERREVYIFKGYAEQDGLTTNLLKNNILKLHIRSYLTASYLFNMLNASCVLLEFVHK
jgi:hypothetical protein